MSPVVLGVKVRADTPRLISSPFDSPTSSSSLPPSQDRRERSLEGVLADLHVQTGLVKEYSLQ